MQPFIPPDAYELRRRHITEWETGSIPLREDIRSANDAAIKFIEATTKSLSYINAGGLIALPVIMGLFGATIQTDGFWIVSISFLLIGGLILAVFANLAGFFAMAKMAEASQCELNALSIQLALVHQPLEQAKKDTNKKNLSAAQDRMRNKLNIYSRVRLVGLSLIAGSLSAFIFAVLLGWAWYRFKEPSLDQGSAYVLPIPQHWYNQDFCHKCL